MSRSWKNLKQLDVGGMECEFVGGFSFNSSLPFIIEMYGVITLWQGMVTRERRNSSRPDSLLSRGGKGGCVVYEYT